MSPPQVDEIPSEEAEKRGADPLVISAEDEINAKAQSTPMK